MAAAPRAVKAEDRSTKVRTFGGFSGQLDCMSITPDGRRVVGSDHGRMVYLWDVSSGREIWSHRENDAELAALEFRPDGRQFVTSEAIRFVEVREGGVVLVEGFPVFQGRTYPRHTACILTLRDAVTWTKLRIFEESDHLAKKIIFTNESTVVVLDAGLRLKGWDTRTGKELFAVAGRKGQEDCTVESPDVYIDRLAVSGDARLVAFTRHDNRSRGGEGNWVAPIGGGEPRSIDAYLRIWDVSANRIHAMSNGMRAIQSIAITRDGRSVATGDVDHRLTLWDTISGRAIREFKAERGGNLMFLGFNPDGSHLLSATGDGYFREWDCGSGRQLRTIRGPKASVRAIAFLPDRLRVAAGADGSEHDPKTGKQVVAPLLIWDADLFPNP